MASKKKVSTASSKKTTRIVKPKAEKPSKSAPASAEPVIETPVAVESAPVVEVEAIAPATATATIELPSATKSQVRHVPKSAVSTKNRPTSGISALLYETRFALGAFFALESIGTRFDERERSGLRNLRRFGVEHAKKIQAGEKVESAQLNRTIGLARKVGELLETRFYAIMGDSFILLDKGLKELEQVAPEYLVRDAEKIKELRENMLNVLAKIDATYDETVDAYKAMMTYVPSVSEEAEQIVEIERQRKRAADAVKNADDLLNEFADLDAIEF